MNVIPTGLALGAEITGIDLSKEVSAAEREFIVNAYTEHPPQSATLVRT